MDALTLDDKAKLEAVTNNAATESKVNHHVTDETDTEHRFAKFFADIKWRKKHCQKSSAESKMMQRINFICCVRGPYFESKVISADHNTQSFKDVVERAIYELNNLVYHGSHRQVCLVKIRYFI